MTTPTKPKTESDRAIYDPELVFRPKTQVWVYFGTTINAKTHNRDGSPKTAILGHPMTTPTKPMTANAKLIVRAVNHVDALAEALRKIAAFSVDKGSRACAKDALAAYHESKLSKAQVDISKYMISKGGE